MKPMLLAKSETLILDDNWTLELKFDGIRAVLHVNDDDVRIETRNEKDITVSFPEVVAATKRMFDKDAVVDGEIIGFNELGIQKLNFVQHRLGVKDPQKVRERQRKFPVVFVAFDILEYSGRELYQRPLTHRRAILDSIIPDDSTKVTMAQVYPVKMMDPLWSFVQEHNMEGLVAKRNESRYYPGTRSPQWLKIKHRKMKVK